MNTIRAIDRQSPSPIYHQIKQILLEEFRQAPDPSKILLTEKGLTQRFHVSRAPVRQALQELADEGYVYRERSKGTFPRRGPIRNASRRLGGLVQYLREQGLDPQSQVTEVGRVRAPERVRSILSLPEPIELFAMSRLILLEGEPLVWVRTYLDVPPSFSPTPEELEEAGTVFLLLERDLGVTCPHGEQQIWATAANAQDAAVLRVRRGAPILVTETTMYTRTGRSAGWSRAIHRADRYKYVFTVTR